MTRIGRNAPCPCGSGKKYKNCCLEKDQAKSSKRLDEKDPSHLLKVMEREFRKMADVETAETQDLVYDGWEALACDPRQAKKCFERALKLDPDLADAYNGLAEIAITRGNSRVAEEYYRKAYEKARVNLGTEDVKAYSWWGELETRPYMRARQGLGLLLVEMKRFDEAIFEFKELLRRNPNDNQGVRYLVAPIYLLKNDLKVALEEFKSYRRHYSKDIPDPHFLFNWALALFLDGQYEESAIKFRLAIFENPYLIPLVLGEEPDILPIWHSNNLMNLDYAYDYFQSYGELWIGKKDAFQFIQFIWEDDEIQEDFEKWVEYWTKLKGLEDVNKRIPLIDLARKIENKRPSAKFFRRLREFILAQL